MSFALGRVLRSALALAAVCAAIGCGSPSRLDVCYAGCDAAYRCGVTTQVQSTNCRNDCTANSGKYSDEDRDLASKCANAGDIRSKQISCLNAASACNVGSLATCMISAVECVNK